MQDWHGISLGAPAAEFDLNQGLEEYFLESTLFEQVKNGDKRVILGPRGSGKSAIFKIIARREVRRKGGPSVIEISPETYAYEVLGDVLKRESAGHWHKRSAFSSAWKYVLYALIISEIVNRGGKTSSKAFKQLNEFAQRKGILSAKQDLFSLLLDYIKRLEELKLSVGALGFAVKSRAQEMHDMYKLKELTEFFPYIDECLNHRSVYVLVDELDKGWDASEDAKNFVAGLFSASMDLNAKHPNLRIYISLRQELYRSMPELSDDAQKFRNIIAEIEWNESDLLKLIAKRICASLRLSHLEEPIETWGRVFEETLSYRQTRSFNYIVDRTQYRPREIIQFASDCINASGPDDDRVGYDVIVEAENRFSESRARDIASEFKYQYPSLFEVFESFRGMTFALTREELELHCIKLICGDIHVGSADKWLNECDTERAIEILWEVGFLKALSVGGVRGRVRSGSRYVGAYQVSSMSLERVSNFNIHPVFRPYFGLREKKGGAGLE